MPDKITIPGLLAKVEQGIPLTMITCYDYPSACIIDRAGVDLVLVGDSVAMTVLGNPNTLPATMDMMVIFARAVAKGCPHSFVIGDMPYMTYQASVPEAIHNAGRFMAEAGVDCVKLEGGRNMADAVRGIVRAGIPVMGHLGLTPQSASLIGGYKVQGRSADAAIALLEDALALQDAGVYSILLELVPARVAAVDHRKAERAHHQHRLRPRLQGPVPDLSRRGGHVRGLYPAPCQALRRGGRCAQEGDGPVRGRDPGSHLSRARSIASRSTRRRWSSSWPMPGRISHRPRLGKMGGAIWKSRLQ